MADTPYKEITEVEATEAGLPGQPDTTYRRDDDGVDRGYNAGTRTYWALGRSPFGSDERGAGPMSRAIAAAQATLEAAIVAEGGRVVCAVMIVHADGIEPSGGVDVHAADDGPQTPQDMLDFALMGVGQLATRFGVSFAVLDAPKAGGQG